MDNLLVKAKKNQKTIVFPEAEDDRILKAIDILLRKKIVKIILLGNPKRIASKLNELKLKCPSLKVIDPLRPQIDFSNDLYNLRKAKGITPNEAKELLKEPIYYGTMMVKKNLADGLVSGAAHPTSHTFRPALQIIKTDKNTITASTFFIIDVGGRILFFSDCALNIEPDANQLADIAVSTSNSAKKFGFKPKVAMLSFSTKGSGQHPVLKKVINATLIAKTKLKNVIIDGEFQVDAALVPEVAKLKAKSSKIQGDANVLIFPDLNSGNIGYKLVERLAKAKAIGPITQGLAKPVNDLSRGCSVEDIIHVAAITSIQAQSLKVKK